MRLPGWATIFSGLLSVAMIVAVALQVSKLDTAELIEMVPESPLFWLVFPIFYLVGPGCEWIIFRRLWNIPGVSGFVALMRKLIYNELLLGYLGEAYFYTWARRRTEMTAAPFGAVKDVAILSALTGNFVTLGLLIVLWPFIRLTELGVDTQTVVLSLGFILLLSIGLMAFRRRIFSLPAEELRYITVMHLVRIAAQTALSALLWHIVLPDVPVIWWLYLATIRLLISRLPFVPNKDVVFAGLAVFMLGEDVAISSLMTMMAGLFLVVHLLVGAILALTDLAQMERSK
ncbi:hypothetical protein GRI97_02285 [Altererythrobacter xixiisoli]|uniref:Flippase-like domain-containing protein n=2 Tax=Croceibacterium xixiisoli TaxID=1476466 RepID=A0A6I4TP10_9SPHN|nr:hypothetical protein [Croceibacterium xixiisoli]